MDKRCYASRKYLATMDAQQGAYRPRVGVAVGWVPAVISAPAEAGDEQVSVEYAWPHFFTKRGRAADNREECVERFALGEVRRAALEAERLPLRPPMPFPAPATRPELAILAFRWGGKQDITHCPQWGETGTSASDTFFEAFLDLAVSPRLGTDYEVWVVYLEDHSDMAKIADSAHVMFGAHHPLRRARHVSAMYFLYPTAFEEGCVPTEETGSDLGAGLVHQKSLFRMMQSVERAGIPTRFPHCSGVYEQLASKRWTYQLSLTPHLRVPPTVAVTRALIERSRRDAAARAFASLSAVKAQQAALRGEPKPREIVKGVAKLGFSWEALDVKYWEKREGLETALSQLTQTIEISDELTGQPHDLEALIVQEYIPHDLELRQYVVDGKVEGTVYTKFCKIKDNLEFGDFKQHFEGKQAARDWMGGDLAALEDGESQR
eukprot:TRINITY_DN15075_c0_g1_i1.p1 TRINITY_DN15075_c0_g1~~TRINITY_DN15075_c0_g1_i1.p1  ORF type:complete len:490 (+),score=112.50 TRINITY_DN15075_c0_g1_i1:168-1472(+)